MRSKAETRYRATSLALVPTFVGGAAGEWAEDKYGLGGGMPDALDFFEHAGNLQVGGAVSAVAVGARALKAQRNSGDGLISREELSTFRRRWLPGILAVTAALSAVTETQWGIRTFPVARWFRGETADMMDAAYAMAAAVVGSEFSWAKGLSSGKLPELEPDTGRRAFGCKGPS